VLIEKDRVTYDAFIKKLLGMVNVEDTIGKPAGTGQCPTSKATLFDYFFNMEKKIWEAWEWLIPPYIHDSNAKYSEILVPTVDTLRTSFVLTLMNNVML